MRRYSVSLLAGLGTGVFLAAAPLAVAGPNQVSAGYARSDCEPHCSFWTRVHQAFDVCWPYDYCYTDYDYPRPCPKPRHYYYDYSDR